VVYFKKKVNSLLAGDTPGLFLPIKESIPLFYFQNREEPVAWALNFSPFVVRNTSFEGTNRYK